jgi:septum formation protein
MLVLASASPRRRDLLTQAGFSFHIHPANISEDIHPNEEPVAYVTRLAREKAEAVFHELQNINSPASDDKNLVASPAARAVKEHRDLPLVVLGADTTVTLDDHILGKPSSPADAARMLRLLSGRTHRVITGLALVTEASVEVASEITAVQFSRVSDEEIAAYVATGEPMDKAGAYAIQGRAARWIPRIEGCYFNVVGLPIARLSALLASHVADSNAAANATH